MANINYKLIFGKNLKRLRLNSGLTQEVLSEKVEVSAQHLSYVESGKRTASFELIIALAHALAVTPGRFFEDKNDKVTKLDRPMGRIIEILRRMPKKDLDRAIKILNLSFTDKTQKS